MFNLQGKTALVTGASRGLGWAMAQALADAGAHVALNARDAAALDQRAAELNGAGRSAEACAFDVTDARGAQQAIDALRTRRGHIDILVANAGINHRSPIASFEDADFRRVIETNLFAVWDLARRVAVPMAEAGHGRIVMIGSITATIARPSIAAYVASKGAVQALTRQMAVELGPRGVTVNAIAPGYFSTDLNAPLMADKEFDSWLRRRTPVGRWGEPKELGAAVVFLASDEASYVNGHVLVVDGGMTIAV